MKKNEFDEMQLSARNRIGYQSFILLAFLLLADNILYGIGVVWAAHPSNTFILLLVSFTFFICRCIWQDALIGPKDTPKTYSAKAVVLILASAVAAILAAGFLLTRLNLPSSSSDGGGQSLGVISLVMWGVIGIVAALKKIKEKKKSEES